VVRQEVRGYPDRVNALRVAFGGGNIVVAGGCSQKALVSFGGFPGSVLSLETLTDLHALPIFSSDAPLTGDECKDGLSEAASLDRKTDDF
jgi:hypothetical protein